MKKKKSYKKIKHSISKKHSENDYENEISKLFHEMKLDNTSDHFIHTANKMVPPDYTFKSAIESGCKTSEMEFFSTHDNSKMNNNYDNDISNNKSLSPNISALDSPKRKKCLKSNFESNSSSTSSKCSNIYKLPETKCIPFKKYIQGNISNSSKRKRLSTIQKTEESFQQMIDIKIQKKSTPFNFSNVIQKYKVFEKEEVCNALNKYAGWFGEITQKSKLNMTTKIKKSHLFPLVSLFKRRYRTDIMNLRVHHLKKLNAVIFKGSFQRYMKHNSMKDKLSCMFMNIIQFNVIIPKAEHNSLSIQEDLKYNFSQLYESKTSLLPDRRSMKCCTPRNLISKEELTEHSPIKDLDTRSKISKTIIDLLWLELKIKKLNSVLTKFGLKSNAYDDFKKLRLKSAMLIKTYKIIMDKRSKSNSRKRKRNKKKTVKQDVAFEHAPIKETHGKLNNKEKDSNATHKVNHNETPRPNRKYKRKIHKQSCEEPGPKRSKLLDDCIKRANTTKLFSLQRTNEVLAQEKTFLGNEDCTKNDVLCKNELNTQNGKDFNLEKKNSNFQGISGDPTDIEIRQILSQLPPIEPLSDDTEVCSSTSVPVSTTDTVHVDCGNGRIMVVLPYVCL